MDGYAAVQVHAVCSLSKHSPSASWGQALSQDGVGVPVAVDGTDRSLCRLGADLAAKETGKKEANEQSIGQARLLEARGRVGGPWWGQQGDDPESCWPEAWPGEECQLILL